MARKNNRQISIEASRRALLADLKKKCKGKTIKKSVPFTNDDVPKYLKWLDNFEEESRKAAIQVT